MGVRGFDGLEIDVGDGVIVGTGTVAFRVGRVSEIARYKGRLHLYIKLCGEGGRTIRRAPEAVLLTNDWVLRDAECSD